jgi:hypothetical protein
MQATSAAPHSRENRFRNTNLLKLFLHTEDFPAPSAPILLPPDL